jgi:hypothetical protein
MQSFTHSLQVAVEFFWTMFSCVGRYVSIQAL